MTHFVDDALETFYTRTKMKEIMLDSPSP